METKYKKTRARGTYLLTFLFLFSLIFTWWSFFTDEHSAGWADPVVLDLSTGMQIFLIVLAFYVFLKATIFVDKLLLGFYAFSNIGEYICRLVVPGISKLNFELFQNINSTILVIIFVYGLVYQHKNKVEVFSFLLGTSDDFEKNNQSKFAKWLPRVTLIIIIAILAGIFMFSFNEPAKSKQCVNDSEEEYRDPDI